MKKLTFLLALALLSGCVQERPWFYPANVSVKNNRVCISVPDDIDGKRELVGIGIYQPGAGGKAEWCVGCAGPAADSGHAWRMPDGGFRRVQDWA